MRGQSLVTQPARPRYKCLSTQGTSQPKRTDDAVTSIGVADRTFTCWWKPWRPGVQSTIFSKWNAQTEYALITTLGGGSLQVLFEARNITNTTTTTVTSSLPALNVYRWNFIQCYYDSVNGLMGLAVNGRPAATSSLVGGINDSTNDFNIGSGAGLGSDGYITRLGTWSRLLTADEALIVYNGGIPLTYQRLKEKMAAIDTNIQAYWNLMEDLTDYGPGGNNLTTFGANKFTIQ